MKIPDFASYGNYLHFRWFLNCTFARNQYNNKRHKRYYHDRICLLYKPFVGHWPDEDLIEKCNRNTCGNRRNYFHVFVIDGLATRCFKMNYRKPCVACNFIKNHKGDFYKDVPIAFFSSS